MPHRTWTWRSDTAEPPLAHVVVLLPVTTGSESATTAERAFEQPSLCGLMVEWRPLQDRQKICLTCNSLKGQRE